MKDPSPIVSWIQIGLWAIALVVFLISVIRGELPGWLAWLSSRQLVGIAICAGLVVSLVSVYFSYTKDCAKLPPPINLENIYGRAYKNEEVQLDGKKFDHCTFENVTFVFEGKALYSFDGVRFIGNPPHVRSDNAVVHGALYIVQFLNRAYPGQNIQWGKTDEHGNPIL